jgi:8-oxo-dGTP pyrophosphatase MutT (NUDIX family)
MNTPANVQATNAPYALVVAVASVITHGGRVLLKQRISTDGNGLWVHFGGKMERGSTVASTIHDEVFQEAGLDLPESRFTQVCYDQGITDYGMPFIILYTHIELEDHELQYVENKEPDKCSAIGWFDVDCLWQLSMWKRDQVATERVFSSRDVAPYLAALPLPSGKL